MLDLFQNKSEMDERASKRADGCSTSPAAAAATPIRGNGGGHGGIFDGEYGTVWDCVIPFLKDPGDRDAVSLVCRRWYEIDAITRKHVTIALCYSTTPARLSRRFPHLESLKIKGKPRASMFNLIPEDWGGYATPWVEEIASSFGNMKDIHLRRMIVKDSDLELLAGSVGNVLEVLKLDKCSGFSTDGLRHVSRSCRKLKTLFLEESLITDNDGEWLHDLAVNNTVLENLNFYQTEINNVRLGDLEQIARRCRSLVSVKIHDCDYLGLVGFFKVAVSLEEFAGGSFIGPPEQDGEDVFNEQLGRYAPVVLPPKLCRLGLSYLGNVELPIVYPVALRLKKLDLLYCLLDTESHCLLIQRCPNLEILEARNVIGDRGLETLARFCKKMKRLRIERGADEQEVEDVEGIVTQRGLNAVARGCLDLEYLAVYVSDISNEPLIYMGAYSRNLVDFRLVLLDGETRITDLPLDIGIRSLLVGCNKLERFALYLRPGGLTDMGLSYVARYSPNIKWMLLGHVGESDEGLRQFSTGCPSLQKLELRGCCFSERALALAALQLTSLRYFWVQGYQTSEDGHDLLAMVRPNWNIELIPSREVIVTDHDGSQVLTTHPAHILGYYSLAGQRTDFPDTVRPLVPPSLQSS